MKTIKKGFNAIEMKNAIQAKLYEKVKDMDFAELRAYMDNALRNDSFWNRINQSKSVQFA